MLYSSYCLIFLKLVWPVSFICVSHWWSHCYNDVIACGVAGLTDTCTLDLVFLYAWDGKYEPHIILVVKSNMKHYIPYDIMPKGIFQECLLDIRFRWTKVSRIKAPDLAFRISLIHGFIHTFLIHVDHHHDHSSTPLRKFRLEVRHLESYRGENPMICTVLVR